VQVIIMMSFVAAPMPEVAAIVLFPDAANNERATLSQF
jgi:hypothetical protein